MSIRTLKIVLEKLYPMKLLKMNPLGPVAHGFINDSEKIFNVFEILNHSIPLTYL
jgi:hypothetical protein